MRSISEYGFKTIFIDNGRPAYHPTDLLKLFIYGYMNRIRSSRQLEKECKRNKTGRFIERSEHMGVYRQRQAIVEHPFGVIKRQWDFFYVMTKKTIKHASADVGLIFTSYILRRIFNLIDQNILKKYLRELGFLFLILSSHFKVICGIFNQRIFSRIFHKTNDITRLKHVFLSKKQFV